MDKQLAREPAPLVDEDTDAVVLLANLTKYAENARGAFADNTQRARRADWIVFSDWCVQNGLAALPALPETVARFIDAMGATKKPATVRRYVSTIATAHAAAEIGNPCARSAVKLALSRLQRTQPTRQKQATALAWEHIDIALSNIGEGLRTLRDRALVLVAYDTLLRRDELANLFVDDLSMQPNGSATLLVRRSKVDQTGEGASKWLAAGTVEHLNAWLEIANIRDGKLFRGVYNSGKVGDALSAEGVHRALKRLARLAGITEGVSGHSCRVGATQDMVAAGVDLSAVMHAGSWKSVRMPVRYAEQLLAARSGMAQLAKKQGR